MNEFNVIVQILPIEFEKGASRPGITKERPRHDWATFHDYFPLWRNTLQMLDHPLLNIGILSPSKQRVHAPLFSFY